MGCRLKVLERRRLSRIATRQSSDHHGTGMRLGISEVLGMCFDADCMIESLRCSLSTSIDSSVKSRRRLQSAVKLVQSAFLRFHCGVLAPGWGMSDHSQTGKWSLPHGVVWVFHRNRSATVEEARDRSIADVDPDGRVICVGEPLLSMHMLF